MLKTLFACVTAFSLAAVAQEVTKDSMQKDLKDLVPLFNYKLRSILYKDKRDPWILADDPDMKDSTQFPIKLPVMEGFEIDLDVTVKEARGLSKITIDDLIVNDLRFEDNEKTKPVVNVQLVTSLLRSYVEAEIVAKDDDDKNVNKLALAPRNLRANLTADVTLEPKEGQGMCIVDVKLKKVASSVGSLNPRLSLSEYFQELTDAFGINIEAKIKESEATFQQMFIPSINDYLLDLAGDFFTSFVKDQNMNLCHGAIKEEIEKAKAEYDQVEAEAKAAGHDVPEGEGEEGEGKEGGGKENTKKETITGAACSTGMSISVFAAMFLAHMMLA